MGFVRLSLGGLLMGCESCDLFIVFVKVCGWRWRESLRMREALGLRERERERERGREREMSLWFLTKSAAQNRYYR